MFQSTFYSLNDDEIILRRGSNKTHFTDDHDIPKYFEWSAMSHAYLTSLGWLYVQVGLVVLRILSFRTNFLW